MHTQKNYPLYCLLLWQTSLLKGPPFLGYETENMFKDHSECLTGDLPNNSAKQLTSFFRCTADRDSKFCSTHPKRSSTRDMKEVNVLPPCLLIYAMVEEFLSELHIEKWSNVI